MQCTLTALTVTSLTSCSCLLLAGSVADAIGARRINLAGCLLTGAFIIACGLARTGIELVMFRAMQGIAVSLCLPTSIAIVSNAAPRGRKRNIGFSCLGFVQPIGFSLGLVLEGLVIDSVGWRFSYFLGGSLSLLLFVASLWALPPDAAVQGPPSHQAEEPDRLGWSTDSIDQSGDFLLRPCVSPV